MDRVTAALAIGSNLGDRRAHIDYAVSALRSVLEGLRVSTAIETIPEGVPGPQSLFLNAAAVGVTTMTARELMEQLHAIEAGRGRTRPFPGAARTLDLDLILLGDQIVTDPDLVVPHARFRERRFVLQPLAEIAPNLRDPVTGKTVEELLAALKPQTTSAGSR